MDRVDCRQFGNWRVIRNEIVLRGDSRSDFSRKEWANVTELRSDGYNVSDRYARQSLTTAHLSLRLIDKTCGEIPSLIFFWSLSTQTIPYLRTALTCPTHTPTTGIFQIFKTCYKPTTFVYIYMSLDYTVFIGCVYIAFPK